MVSSSLSTAEETETGLKVLEVSVLELYYRAPYGKRTHMTITRIGKKFCIALPIQVGIVSMISGYIATVYFRLVVQKR